MDRPTGCSKKTALSWEGERKTVQDCCRTDVGAGGVGSCSSGNGGDAFAQTRPDAASEPPLLSGRRSR